MKEGFLSSVEVELGEKYNISVTENGALGYRTTGKTILDLNFAVSSLRSAGPAEIERRFLTAFFEDKMVAMKWLFFARDARSGLGERRLFRLAFKMLATSLPEYATPVIGLIPFYGRFDDMWQLLDTKLADDVLKLVKTQLDLDINGERPSLLAKWLPSSNTSSDESRRFAKIIIKSLGLTESAYRKTLSKLREKLDVVERKMTSKSWGEINYESVPSNANVVYRGAFLRNDETRRREFLGDLERGEAKINASVLFPPQIAHSYADSRQVDPTIEALWKALPDTVGGEGNAIVVADGSGSMTCTVGNTNVSALTIANSLAIYIAERASGEFKDRYITFSGRPQLVDLSKGNSLYEKLKIALTHSEIANTNVEAVFALILNTALNGKMSQNDLPKRVIIISDMEFDLCACSNSGAVGKRLFEEIGERYANAGYALPKLVFWNVCSRTGTIPVTQNELGVTLVSGFSTNILKMVLSDETDPYENLLAVLNGERYAPVEAALKEAGVL
ncbi:MAG: DUF2828 family protein [Clostridiales bacterium]|nr:DUF2828 family protein [Clostridiales bacterium]